MTAVPTIKPKVTRHYCPDCGYMLSPRQVVIACVRKDYLCPDCKDRRCSVAQVDEDK